MIRERMMTTLPLRQAKLTGFACSVKTHSATRAIHDIG